jgi:transcriptional regulator of acetoin/glycerol metabolism
MPLSLQSRILRVLQDREVMPLGGGKPTAVDFLPVAATHRPLQQLVAEGRFRPDLYYRLAHYVVELPALRDLPGKPEILHALWRQTGAMRDRVTLSAAAEAALLSYSWPGNFRQLAGAVRAMLALADPGVELQLADLPVEIRSPVFSAPIDLPGVTLNDLTDEAIRRAIDTAGGNVARAARALGIDRSTLYRRVLWKGGSRARH